MNTLKRKLTAILLTFAMLFSLMPALPQAAEAATATATSENGMFNLAYDQGLKTLNIEVKDLDGQLLDKVSVDNFLAAGSVATFKLTDTDYEIVSIERTENMNNYYEYPIVNDKHQYRFSTSFSGSEATLTVNVKSYEGPDVSEFIYNESETRLYRLYNDQIWKMIYKYSEDKNVSVDTTIESITPTWYEEFGVAGSGSDTPLYKADREQDYYNQGYTFNDVAGGESLRLIQPYNMESLVINYRIDGADKQVTIPADDLRFTVGEEASAKYYNIELADDSFHIVYFYNETDGNIGNNYFLYDIRFVNHGESLGENMPADPTYEGGTFYRFINWDLGSWDGSTHQPFLSTTIVNDDYTVFARKAGSNLSGTEVHVVNGFGDSENELLSLVAKLYSAANETNISAENIDKSTVEISVYDNNGDQTNEDASMNGWSPEWQDVDYYKVSNCDVSWNDHLSQANLSKIRVMFDLTNDTHGSVDIPIGEYADQLSVYMASTENIIELIVNQPGEVQPAPGGEDPEPGSIDWDKLTIDKTVDKETAKPGDTVTYKITVTNNTGKDLTNVKVSDELDENLTFVSAEPVNSYVAGAWTIGELTNGNSATLTITAKVNDGVAAGTMIKNAATITDAKAGDDTLPDEDKPSDEVDVTVEPKDPTPPSEEDITKLINGAEVAVNCINEKAGHEPLTIKFGEVNDTKFTTTQSGDTITVTVDDGAFIANYVAKRNNIPHSYVADGSDLTLTLKYVENVWKLDSSDNKVTINTICELPQPPTDEDLIKLLNEATADVECITTGSNHNKESFNFGEVTNYKFTTEQTDPYTITVEVDPAAFIENYDEVYKLEVHTFVQSEDVEQDVQLIVKFVDGAWALTKNTISIKVSCGFDLTGVDKTLVTKGELENAAKDAGVEVTNYFLPASMKDTVIVPYNGSVTLLYAIMVEGKGGADFAVQDPSADLVNTPINTTAQISKDDTTGMFIGMIPEGANSVTFYVSRTFTTADIKDGVLSNTVELFGQNGSTVEPDPDTDNKDEETIPAEEGTEENVVKITPSDITAYEGGNGGYNGVVDDGNTTDVDSNMPHPMFYISVPDGSDPTNLTFTNEGKVWTVVADGTDANGNTLYHFEQGTGQDPVRVTYTYEKDGKVVTVNDLSQLGDIGEVFTYLSIDLYAGENNLDDVRASFNGKSYAITTGSGRLTVRAVEADDPNTVTSDIRETAPTTDEGTAVAVEPENTTYTLNNTDVELPADSQPSLLFDNIINDDGVNRTDALENKADQKLNANDGDYNYEIMYLDLVDTNNGNAWITSSEGTDIYWDYPEGTDRNTDFEILHFTGLHREDSETTDSGFEIEDLESISMDEIENVTIKEKTDDYIVFHVTEANFSPYALAWETDNGGSDTPGGDTPGGNDPWYPPYNPGDDDKPSGLNTEDHFSYVVGYEDGMVKPQRSITRAEVATIFYRLLEDDVRDDYDTTRNNFSDVTSDSWYNQTVSTLASMGILKGYEDGTFRPNASITRAEFAAIATRFFEETGATYEPGTFTDVTGSEWFAGAIADAVNLGLIGGYEDGTVRPNNNITRAEACAIVNRTLGRVPDADHLLPADEMTTWPDNPSSAWFYADMQEATNGHEYEWITEDGNKIEEWTDILDKDWNDR